MNTLLAVLPVAFPALGAFIVLLGAAFSRKDDHDALGYVSVLAIAASVGAAAALWGRDLSAFGGMLVLDRFGLFVAVAAGAGAAFAVLMALKSLRSRGMNHAEFPALVLLGLCGIIVMATSTDLLVVFLGLEVLSIPSYALAGLRKRDDASSEAAVKYFLLGSFASAFLVFGLALVFGASGSLGMREAVAAAWTGAGGISRLGVAGLGLVFAGMAFKAALVPFHAWAPDVYQGAPTPVTAFYAVGPKIAALAVLLRLTSFAAQDAPAPAAWRVLLGAAAVLSMLAGNLAALRQTDLKRLLAYSGIAHAGYMALAVLAADAAGLLFYFAVYLLMNAGAFAALMALRCDGGPEATSLDDLSGLGRRHPWVGASLAVFMLSLAGFPPTAGFLAKFYVFSEAARRGYGLLVVVALLATLVSVAYYLRVVVTLFMRDPVRDVALETADRPALALVLFLCLAGVLQLGVLPGNVLALVRQAASSLF